MGEGGCPRQEDKAEVKGPLASLSPAMCGSIAGPQVALNHHQLLLGTDSTQASALCWCY